MSGTSAPVVPRSSLPCIGCVHGGGASGENGVLYTPGCVYCAGAGPGLRQSGRVRPAASLSIRPPALFVTPDLESPQGPLDLCGQDGDHGGGVAVAQKSQHHHGHNSLVAGKPAWDMDTLKRAICSARTGAGEVARIIDSCTFKPREQAFTALINMCGQLRDWRKAVEVFEAMKHTRGVRPNTYTYSALIAACSSAGEWQHALKFFGLMKLVSKGDPNCQPNEVTYSALITACERGGQFEKALEVYDDMVTSGVCGDHITFSSALSACEKSGNWVRAERILHEMHAKGLSGNVGIYSEMMLNYAENGNWERALDMCLTMANAGQDPMEGSKRRRAKNGKSRSPSEVPLQADKCHIPSPAASGASSSQSWTASSPSPTCDHPPSSLQGASPVSQQGGPAISKPAWDMETLKRAICFAKSGTGEVHHVIETCTFRPREQAFTALINMCGRLRDWRKAMEVFEGMKHMRGVRPNTFTYSALIAACSSSGEWEKALEIFEVMKASAVTDPNCRPNEVTYSALITACQRGGMFDRGLKLYDEMMKDGVRADQITFSSVLAACEKSERWDRVEKILEDMHKRGMTGTSSIYAELINYHSEQGDWLRALHVFTVMQIAGQEPEENTIRAVMFALERGKQFHMMMNLFNRLQASGNTIDTETYNAILRVVAQVQAHRGHPQVPQRPLAPGAEMAMRMASPNMHPHSMGGAHSQGGWMGPPRNPSHYANRVNRSLVPESLKQQKDLDAMYFGMSKMNLGMGGMGHL